MQKYIALLRGINVGGKNKVPMPLLKAALEDAGLAGVSTYINSGNIIFTSSIKATAELQRLCSRVIADAFGLHIPVAVISARDYAEALAHMPEWWGSGEDVKHNAIFVIAPATAAALVAEVGVREEYESIAHHGSVIFWSAPLGTFSRTKWAKAVATPAYSHITIRNFNTAKKLLELISE